MTIFAYLRVSTNQQDGQNQKFGILDYCNKNDLSPINFKIHSVETLLGKTEWLVKLWKKQQ